MSIANQMAKTSRVELPKVMEAPTPTIAEFAVLPTRRSSPSLSKNVSLGALSLLFIVFSASHIIFDILDFSGRHSAHYTIIRHILRDDSSCRYNHIVSDLHAGKNRHIAANPDIISDRNRLCDPQVLSSAHG